MSADPIVPTGAEFDAGTKTAAPLSGTVHHVAECRRCGCPIYRYPGGNPWMHQYTGGVLCAPTIVRVQAETQLEKEEEE